ncbi:hypothetical protein NPIL_261861 [Nephila pilipes]|uniref:Uncharacterized protein n=1 Tax=Nephila pilipes TaxID=299642 RepID=A0A8X6QK25_NEPPI|nr:hypothetical protein NPIL_261861 [Nephila pilipes]
MYFSLKLRAILHPLCVYNNDKISRKILKIREVTTLFAELPSDSDSDASDVTSDLDEEEFIEPPERITEVEEIVEEESDIYNYDIEAAELSDSSVPFWSKQEVEITLPEFKEDYGLTGEILDLNDSSLANVFLSILSFQFIEHIVIQSNLYAKKNNVCFLLWILTSFNDFLL